MASRYHFIIELASPGRSVYLRGTHGDCSWTRNTHQANRFETEGGARAFAERNVSGDVTISKLPKSWG